MSVCLSMEIYLSVGLLVLASLGGLYAATLGLLFCLPNLPANQFLRAGRTHTTDRQDMCTRIETHPRILPLYMSTVPVQAARAATLYIQLC